MESQQTSIADQSEQQEQIEIPTHLDQAQSKTQTNEAEEANQLESGDNDDEREPKLYVDVNVANFGLQRIIVYEGDTVESLVQDFVKRCPIDEFMIEKLKTLLQQQIDGVLERIDEDDDGLSDLEEVEDKNDDDEEEDEEIEDVK